MDIESKQESSIPVQSRVSIVTLAELDKYWQKDGYQVRTMSQLIAWSLERLTDILKSNGVGEGVETVAEAHRYLTSRGLYQNAMLRRGAPKIGNALKCEALREDGVDPKSYIPQHYNMRHNSNSVEIPVLGRRKNNFDQVKFVPLEEYPDYMYPEGDEETKQRLIKQLEMKGIKSKKSIVSEAIEDAKKRGQLAPGDGIKQGMTDEELDEYNRQRDAERLALENAPLDPEFIKSQMVKKE